MTFQTEPRARKVTFSSLSFSGRKEVNDKNDTFEFNWKDLGAGLWAVMSDKNSRGKSSILNILKASLQGDFPGDIKPDVWRWISDIDVGFKIDDVSYHISVRKISGQEDLNSGSSSLQRLQESRWSTLFEGDISKLKGHVEALFMEELSFSKIHAVNRYGTAYEHSWPTAASALIIKGDSENKALFGEHLVDGLPLRLLQLFIGMPWISTLTAVLSAKKIITPGSRSNKDPFESLRNRLLVIEKELEELSKKKVSPASRISLRRKMSELDFKLAGKQAEISKARSEIKKTNEEFDFISNEMVKQARLLQELKDEKNAGYVFRNLRPEHCPACEADFSKTASMNNVDSCILCKSELPEEDGAVHDETLENANVELDAINENYKGLSKKVKLENNKLRGLEKEHSQIFSELNLVQKELDSSSDDHELRYAELNSAYMELKALLDVSDKKPDQGDDKLVVEGAEKYTRELIDHIQGGILEDISEVVLRLSKTFGVRNLTNAVLNSQGHLKLTQGGATVTFSKLTSGERLRVKIAAALAAVEVARDRGLGRHPGLLLLDSPGAGEVIDDDFYEMLANVSRVAHEMGGVQVFIGSVYRTELAQVIPEAHCRRAEGSDSLF